MSVRLPLKLILVLSLNLLISACTDVSFEPTEVAKERQRVHHPSVEINNGDEFTNSTRLNLALEAENAVEMYITDDPACESGGEWEPFSPTKSWSLSKENISASIFAKYRNHKDEVSDCVHDKIIHDNIPPKVTITSAPPALTNQARTHFRYQIQDNLSGAVAAECWLGSNSSSCALNGWQATVKQGRHDFYIVAVDRAGNRSEAKGHKWLVDITPPVIYVTESPNGMTNKSTGQVAFQVSDTLSEVKDVGCQFSGGSLHCSKNTRQVFRGLGVGRHELKVTAQDAAGNITEKSISWNVAQALKPVRQKVEVLHRGELDVLFVIDNSGSMRDEQVKMAEKFNHFLYYLTDLSWRIGITTTAVNSNYWYADGRLSPFNSKHAFIDWQMTPELAQDLFASNIRRDEVGSDEEQGIYATYRAIERRKTDAKSRAFFRDNAHLEVIVVTDEDESGDTYHNDPQGLIDYVQDTWTDEKRFRFHSIMVRPDDPSCRSIYGHRPGETYLDLVRLTDGFVGDICASDYSSQLSKIAEDVSDSFNRVKLVCMPWDTNGDGLPEVSVEFDPEVTPIPYTIQGQWLVFDGPTPLGSHSVNYQCADR